MRNTSFHSSRISARGEEKSVGKLDWLEVHPARGDVAIFASWGGGEGGKVYWEKWVGEISGR